MRRIWFVLIGVFFWVVLTASVSIYFQKQNIQQNYLMVKQGLPFVVYSHKLYLADCRGCGDLIRDEKFDYLGLSGNAVVIGLFVFGLTALSYNITSRRLNGN